MLVYLPGYGDLPPAGYVEEWWPRAGVNVEIRERVQWENLLFFMVVLVVAGLYVGNTALVTTLQRWGELGLLKALGWREATVARRVLGQFLWPALVAGLLGVLTSQGVARQMGLTLSFLEALVVVPVSVFLALLGGSAGLGVVRRVTPISGIRSGDVRASSGAPNSLGRSGTGLWGLAWSSLAGRPGASLVNVVVIAVATGFLVLLVVLVQATRGYLWGNLLGAYIMVRVESYHLAMAVVALAVATIAAADAALLGILRRRGELSLLLAVGWRPGHVVRLVLAEGVLLGAMGALAGLILGVAAALFFTGEEVTLARVLTTGSPAALVPLLVIPLAVLAVATQAARLAPAKALRGE
jgi:ABC-type antimicrobial peptide transport system permease subunit